MIFQIKVALIMNQNYFFNF